MSFLFTHAKTKIAKGQIDLSTDTLKVLLVGTLSNANTKEDADVLDDITLDEFSDATYSRKTATGQTVTNDDGNKQSIFDMDDVDWPSLDGDTAKGVIIYKHMTDDSDSIPIAHIDTGGFSVTPSTQDFRIKWNAGGVFTW